jgi:hypothetical protein
MRLIEFITESVTGQDVLSYIQRTHHEPLTAQLSRAVLQQPKWELRPVPLQDLHIPDQGYDDDPEYEPAADPYDRVQDIDPEHAGEVSIHNVDRKPIVIDREGYIIDGNHRAWAAAELLGRDTIQAWVPVEQIKEDEQVLDEFSDHDSGIRKALEKKGYKFLGAGVDQMAYLEPSTGYILKIFGTQGGKDFSQDQKMFFKFAKFCMKHQDNPFLPRFYGYESFEFKGKTYLQIRTEQLFKNKNLQHAVSELGDELKRDTMRGYRHPDSAGWMKEIKKTILKTVKTPDRLELLIQTLKTLYLKGSKNKYRWDLHSDNIMVRKDGTPVINDPWVIW